MTVLRLVHSARPILTAAHLVHFATPKTWPEILTLTPRMSSTRWREAIVDADEYGFGLLQFVVGVPVTGERRSRRGWWVLTDKGRELLSFRT